MILLLLFSISSTIRASALKNQNQNLFTCGAVNLRNAAENYKKNIADFLVGSKYEKLCKFTRNVV